LRVVVRGLAEGEQVLDSEAARYVAVVHRLGPGARLLATDPERGLEADAELVRVRGREVVCRIGVVRAAPATAARVTLVQALAKADKVDRVVGAATALGVARIVVMLAERCVPRPADARRRDRWRRIAEQASRQSGRGRAPEILGPLPVAEALAAAAEEHAARLCLDPAAAVCLGAALAAWSPADPLVLLVGPEGGLSAAEQAAALAAGFLGCRLGRLVLRTETAAVAALGAVVARLGATAGATAEGY
jgi:16S rRNA (uracil1498-N3)-methyltransferase